MHKSKFLFLNIAFFIVCLLSANNSFAQTDETRQPRAEQSYEVVLQILVASNNPISNANVPQSLVGVVKKLRTNYALSNYSLSSTYLQRIANTGNIEFKSISSETNKDTYAPTFSEWTLARLQNLPGATGGNAIQVQNFRFGQRVPIVMSSTKDDSGRINPVVNYESVGLTMQKLSLPENVPTIVGSLSTSKNDELLFLIMTVKPVE